MAQQVSAMAEARAMVKSCPYPPLSHARLGARPALRYATRSQGDKNEYLNEPSLLIAMQETPEVIEKSNATVAINGIDMLDIGSSDLSTEMSVPGQ